jgi:hypothetical protein
MFSLVQASLINATRSRQGSRISSCSSGASAPQVDVMDVWHDYHDDSSIAIHSRKASSLNQQAASLQSVERDYAVGFRGEVKEKAEYIFGG